MDDLSVHGGISHEVNSTTSYYRGRLYVDVYAVQQALQGWDNVAIRPAGCQGVDPDRKLSGFKQRDKSSPKTEHSMFASS
jgi:hypothetical protein